VGTVGRSGRRGNRWPPRVADDRGAETGQDIGAVFAHRVDVAADVQAGLSDVLAGEPPGNLLLGLRRAPAAFADVIRRPYPGVTGEPQDIIHAGAAELQQDPPGWLGGRATRARVCMDLGEPNANGVPERGDQRLTDQRRDLGLPGVAGGVERVDQPAHRTTSHRQVMDTGKERVAGRHLADGATAEGRRSWRRRAEAGCPQAVPPGPRRALARRR